MKNFLILPLFLIPISLFLFLWWNNASSAPRPKDATPRKFLITKGQSAGKIAKELAKTGLIKSELAFRLYTQFTGREKAIQAGNYELSPSSSLGEMVKVLIAGPKEIWVTYPEGLRREEIAAKTVKTLGLDGEQSRLFWEEFLKETEAEEGFLFPETYLFPRDVTAGKVAKKLRSTFDAKFSEQMVADSRSSGMSLKELITLASIIERETKTDEERPIVAGILVKRLENGWPLQADATLQYLTGTQRCQARKTPALDCDWWNIPTNEDKKIKSSFNTYLNRGLPPSPIANPGLSSIKAAIYPADSPYWYYLHDGSGKIYYAKTIEEHSGNIARYLK